MLWPSVSPSWPSRRVELHVAQEGATGKRGQQARPYQQYGSQIAPAHTGALPWVDRGDSPVQAKVYCTRSKARNQGAVQDYRKESCPNVAPAKVSSRDTIPVFMLVYPRVALHVVCPSSGMQRRRGAGGGRQVKRR